MPSHFGTPIGQIAAIYGIKSRTRAKRFLFIRIAANIFWGSDKFYKVLLVFYSLPITLKVIN